MKREITLVAVFILVVNWSFGQGDSLAVKQVINNTRVSGQWFVAVSYDDHSEMNKFQLKRGYINFKNKINDKLSVRYTQDITVDKEGEDAGNVETRMKYLYMKIKAPPMAFVTNSYFEAGLVHRPWLDFEQKINRYRIQGKMFVERYKIINSADFGVAYVGLLGTKVDKSCQQSVNKKYPGKYGSISLGVFNGGGYSSPEMNNNKTVEGRLSLRPLPKIVPGVQLSYAIAYGKANTETNTDNFIMNLAVLSWESRYHSFLAQYYFGEGSYGDDYLGTNGMTNSNTGYSVFGELKISHTPFSLFSSYNRFESNAEGFGTRQILMGGVAYHFLKSKLVLHYENADYSAYDVNSYELALEIGF